MFLSDQAPASTQQEGDLPGLHPATRQRRAAGEGGEVVADGRWAVPQDPADLRRRLALQRQADDLGAVGQYRPDVVNRASQRDQHARMGLPQCGQVPRNGSRRDQENSVGQVLAGQQAPLTECLLTKRRDAGLPKPRRPLLVKETVVFRAAMERQANRLLLAIRHGLAGRFVGTDRHERDLAGRRRGCVRVGIGKIHFLDDLQDRLGLEGRAIQALPDLLEKLGVEGLAMEAVECFLLPVAASHEILLPDETRPDRSPSDICLEGKPVPQPAGVRANG